MMYPQSRSNWWFLLPIFLGLIGGVIAYFVLRNSDPPKAKNCLYLGVILGVLGIIFNLFVASEFSAIDPDAGFGINI